MRTGNWKYVALLLMPAISHAQRPGSGFHPTIPRTWDDEQIATLELPLANPAGSPKHVSSDYYYRIPVRPIYKQYAVYRFTAPVPQAISSGCASRSPRSSGARTRMDGSTPRLSKPRRTGSRPVKWSLIRCSVPFL